MNPNSRFFNNSCPAKPFGFDDIQKGDKIKRVRICEDGTELTTVGIADTLETGYWLTTGREYLASTTTRAATTESYELLERVDPPKDHIIMRTLEGQSAIASNPETLDDCQKIKDRWEDDSSPRTRMYTYTIVKLVPVDEK